MLIDDRRQTMIFLGALLVLLALVVPAGAETLYTVRLTDDQVAVLQEQTRVRNETKTLGAKGVQPAPVTDEQMLEQLVHVLLNGLEHGQADGAAHKEWAERTPHEKRVSCRRQKIAAKDCPK